jgi:hypothetical protein
LLIGTAKIQPGHGAVLADPDKENPYYLPDASR